MAELGIRASIQPAHLLDDRDLTERIWGERSERCFAFRWMLDDGVELAMGSDAPVSPLDPWLAIAAAVHRSADERDPWHPEHALTPREALAASTDGWGTVAPGHPGDLVLLDRDPLAPAPRRSRPASCATCRWPGPGSPVERCSPPSTEATRPRPLLLPLRGRPGAAPG